MLHLILEYRSQYMRLSNVYDNLISEDKLKQIEDYVSNFKYSRFETDNEDFER